MFVTGLALQHKIKSPWQKCLSCFVVKHDNGTFVIIKFQLF
jgi:hypothetical protein